MHVLDFDEELAQKFADLKAADPDNDNVEWKAINADLVNRSNTVSNTFVTTQIQNATSSLDTGVVDELNNTTQSDYVADTNQYVNKGILSGFKIKEKSDEMIENIAIISKCLNIINKEETKWTSEETKYIAEQVTNAIETKNCPILKAVFECLLIEEDKIQCDVHTNMAKYTHTITQSMDKDKCNKILGQIDKMKHPIAYNLFYRTSCYRMTEDISSLSDEKMKYPLNVTVENGKLTVNLWNGECNYQELDINTDYPKELLEKLPLNNTSVEAFTDLLILAQKQEDIELLYNLYEEKYDKIFVPYTFADVSKTGEMYMGEYATKLLYAENGYDKFEKFVNDMLYENKEKCIIKDYDYRQYLEVISDYALVSLNEKYFEIVDAIYGSDKHLDYNVLSNYKEEIAKQLEIYETWVALEAQTRHTIYAYDGYSHFTVKVERDKTLTNLKNHKIEYILKAVGENGKTVDSYEFPIAEGADDAIANEKRVSIISDMKSIENYKKMSLLQNEVMHRQEELNKNSYEFLMITSATGKIAPISTGVLSLYVDLLTQDSYYGIKDGGGLIKDITGVNMGLATTELAFLQKYLQIGKTREKDQLYDGDSTINPKNAKDNSERTILSLIGSGASYSVSNEVGGIKCGIYNPFVIQNIKCWEEEGLEGIVGNKSEKSPEKIADDIGYQDGSDKHTSFENGIKNKNASGCYGSKTKDMREMEKLYQEYYQKLIFGEGDMKILEMDPERLAECINGIEKNLNGRSINEMLLEEK